LSAQKRDYDSLLKPCQAVGFRFVLTLTSCRPAILGD
jgi:hypothetical protein